jgi:DNA-binding NtrC family response regulator
MKCPVVLIVDDDPAVRSAVRDLLLSADIDVVEADSGHSAQQQCICQRPSLALIDHILPDTDALSLLECLRRIDGNLLVAVLTGYGTIDLTVRTMRAGADYFFPKPFRANNIPIIRELLRTHRQGTQGAIAKFDADPFLGCSPAIAKLAEMARRAYRTDASVLIEGETGSGKSVLARWLHANGPHADQPFVEVNCVALSRELLESELFGHAKGSFTGAVSDKPGLFEAANGGTLFLDEIGDMPLDLQPKLLKAIEEQRFRRIGEVRERKILVRIISATQEGLEDLIEQRRFRADLYYRISGLTLRVPPLRERKEDIGILADRILLELTSHLELNPIAIPGAVRSILQFHSWPGNIRERRNVLQRALVGRDNILELQPGDIVFGSCRAISERDGDNGYERLEAALRAARGSVEQAGRHLGIPTSTLYQKIKRLGINIERFRSPRISDSPD